jgi:uncharacterized protein with von Willebrand factor type A (vWA) domain
VFLDFFFELRRRRVPIALQEWMTLMEALAKGLHESSLDGFYHLARAICVKDLAHYDAFDSAFLAVFEGIEKDGLAFTAALQSWLANPRLLDGLSAEQRALLQGMDPDELKRLFEERLREQKERHEGGSKWIGTGGTSPFGSGGYHPSGVRIGQGGRRTAMQVAHERRYSDYRSDRVLDVRRMDVALRMLRVLGREGAPEELDIDATIEQTARNAGDLDVVVRPRRRNRARVTLLMDVGGSMDPFAHLVEQLFTAASRAGRFARFRPYYFHNCVYECVYEDAAFRRKVPLPHLLGTSDRDEILVIVGDAAMHPAELLQPGGTIYFYDHNERPGIEWMKELAEHFPRRAWLNPEPPSYWKQTMTAEILGRIYPMFPLTLEGLEGAVRRLLRTNAAG